MDHDPLDPQGLEAARADAAAKARNADETEEADIRWLMNNRRGRRILWRLLDQTGVFRSTFNPTAMVMAFQEGNRNFGNRMLGLIHTHSAELYPTMMKENTHAGKPADRANQ